MPGTPSLNFLQAGCSSSRPTNSVKAMKATHNFCAISVIDRLTIVNVISAYFRWQVVIHGHVKQTQQLTTVSSMQLHPSQSVWLSV